MIITFSQYHPWHVLNIIINTIYHHHHHHQVTDLRVSCEMVEKKARETRQAEEKVDDLFHNDDDDCGDNDADYDDYDDCDYNDDGDYDEVAILFRRL